MKTFSKAKALRTNPHFKAHKQRWLARLTDTVIDKPIVAIIKDLNKRADCFTLQSCYGHFIYPGQTDRYNFDSWPVTENIAQVSYRIAYLAVCIANCGTGRDFLDRLKSTTAIDPQNIQFGCADWFWQQQINSYVLQVLPERYQHQDQVQLDYREALEIEKLRNRFFEYLRSILADFDCCSGGEHGNEGEIGVATPSVATR